MLIGFISNCISVVLNVVMIYAIGLGFMYVSRYYNLLLYVNLPHKDTRYSGTSE